jgi:hypothetical protein
MNKIEVISFRLIRTHNGNFIPFGKDKKTDSLNHMEGYKILNEIKSKIPQDLIVNSHNADRYFLDLFEVALFKYLGDLYRAHWMIADLSIESMLPLGGSFIVTGSYPKPTNETVSVLSVENLKNKLSGNILVDNGYDSFNQISLPYGADVKVTRANKISKLDRRIRIENDYFNLLISIGNGGVHGFRPSLIESSKFENIKDINSDWQVQDISLVFNVSYKDDKILSEETAKQHEWIEQMVEYCRWAYDWKSIWSEIKSSS